MADSQPTENVVHNAGFFDGFESYLSPTQDDYKEVLNEGLVVLDTNALLNLYRYAPAAREDLFAVLERLGDRLWEPHQVVAEFWRNRESVLRDPRDTQWAINELTSLRDRARRSFETWSNRVSLAFEDGEQHLSSIAGAFDSVMEAIDKFTDPRAIEAARDTNLDEVLSRLGGVLQNRVGRPLEAPQHAEAVAEGLRRVAEQIPPGYKDKSKEDEGAAGDYLVWEQVILEASRRQHDVLFVTGDVKEDWWREERGERRGPRRELVEELRQRSGRRLFMIRPPTLLNFARTLLSVTVREESVQDADRVELLLSMVSATLPPGGGWDKTSLAALMDKLELEAPVQAAAIRLAADNDGFVSRDEIYQLGSYSEDRSLRGFTRPIYRITRELKNAGVVSRHAVDIFSAVYNQDSPGFGWAAGFRPHPQAQLLLVGEIAGDIRPQKGS